MTEFARRPEMARPLAGLAAWIISDGKAGHEAQCRGVAEALGVAAEVKRVDPPAPYRWLAPHGPVPRRARFAPPWPVIALATGRLTIPYIRALKADAGAATFTVILLDPRTGAESADLIWVPEHDRRRGDNVIRALASPHVFSPERIAGLRLQTRNDIAALPRPRIAVLLGGPNRDYSYGSGEFGRLACSLAGLARSGAGLMITTSRRTPDALKSAVLSATDGAARVVYDGDGDNPYPLFLAHADRFVVTADSVNMACEAAATGRPIHIFTPSGSAAKFDRFHAGLRAHGATRPLPENVHDLETWTYAPLDSARMIADEIGRRWLARQTD